MDMQWDEDEKLEEILERRRVEGGPLQAEVMQKVPQLVVHGRVSQCKQVKGIEEKKKVKGWSTEERKNKPCDDTDEDTEEMSKWRSMRQEEMDVVGGGWLRRWRERFWTSTRWRTATEVLTEAEAPRWNGGVYEEA